MYNILRSTGGRHSLAKKKWIKDKSSPIHRWIDAYTVVAITEYEKQRATNTSDTYSFLLTNMASAGQRSRPRLHMKAVSSSASRPELPAPPPV